MRSFRRSAGSFRFAAAGLAYLVRSQPNFRVHLALACLAAALGLVLALEAVNTALETLLDLLHPEQHALAGLAKDLAAAAVLLAALASLAVGAVLFLPRLWRLL